MCRKYIFVKTVKKLNLWEKTTVDKSAWIKAWHLVTFQKNTPDFRTRIAGFLSKLTNINLSPMPEELVTHIKQAVPNSKNQELLTSMGSHGVPCLKQLGGSFTNWIFNPFMATTANRNSWMNEWMNGFISCWWKIHSWTWSRISQQRPILTKKDTLILYSNLFKKVLQKDKVLLILHEMKQGPKTGHNFCLH